MGSRPGTAPGEAPRTAVHEAEEGSRPVRPAPATILLLAVWIGLVAGFLDLGLMILKRHLIDGEILPPRRGVPLDHPRGGRGAGAVARGGARPGRPAAARRGSPSGSPWGSSRSSGSSTCVRTAAPGALGVAAALRGARGPGRPAGRPAPARLPPARAPDDPVARRGRAGPRAGDVRRPRLVGASGGRRAPAAAPRGAERAADRLGHGPGQRT